MCLCVYDLFSHLGLKQGILEAVASGAVTRADEVKKLMFTTLFAVQHPFEVEKEYEEALLFLQQQRLIEPIKTDGRLHATLLGQAVFASGLSPVDGLALHQVNIQMRMNAG